MKSFIAILSFAALVAAGPISRRQESVGMTCRVAGGEGICQTSATGCSGGSFQAADASAEWPCWGNADIQCCVPGGGSSPDTDNQSTDSDEAPAPSSTGGSNPPPAPTEEPTSPPASDDASCPGAGPGGNGHIDCAGASHLEKVEGLRLEPYPDQRGDTTIGIGHNCVVRGACPDPLPDKAAAYELMYKDLVEFEEAVCSWNGAGELNQNQFNAMVSYAFQWGQYGAKDIWEPQIAAKDFAGISAALPTSNPIDNRRTYEKELFDTPTDVKSGC